MCIGWGGGIMYGYSEPNNLHTLTRQDTDVWAVYCHSLLMEISMMTKLFTGHNELGEGGQQQTLLLGGIHTGNNFKKGPG